MAGIAIIRPFADMLKVDLRPLAFLLIEPLISALQDEWFWSECSKWWFSQGSFQVEFA
jgi:hypothetical protein